MTRITAFFSAGFRPMFLGAALWAVVSMGLWISFWTGMIEWSAPMEALDWHIHELLFGYGGAVLCGFLLTAIPHWTGRPVVQGTFLAGLWILWGLGRAAVSIDTGFPLEVVAALDVGFLLLISVIAGREVWLAGNNRNLPVEGMVLLFALANLAFHVDVMRGTGAAWGYGTRFGIGVLILLISLIGGRIVPTFTTNWLKKRGAVSLPTAVNGFDKAVLATTAVSLTLWSLRPDPSVWLGGALLAIGLAHLGRMARWSGFKTLAEPLIFALHLAYAFVPFGFLLTGVSLI